PSPGTRSGYRHLPRGLRARQPRRFPFGGEVLPLAHGMRARSRQCASPRTSRGTSMNRRRSTAPSRTRTVLLNVENLETRLVPDGLALVSILPSPTPVLSAQSTISSTTMAPATSGSVVQPTTTATDLAQSVVTDPTAVVDTTRVDVPL